MNVAICSQCGAEVPTTEITRTPVGAYCAPCHRAELADAARGERDLLRTIGRKQASAGILMLLFALSILALGTSRLGGVAMIPIGLLGYGAIELYRGLSKMPN